MDQSTGCLFVTRCWSTTPPFLSLSVFPPRISHWRTVRWHCQLSFPKAAGGIACDVLRLQRAFCVKPGAGPLVWKFPVKSCDRLAPGATEKGPGLRGSSDAIEQSLGKCQEN